MSRVIITDEQLRGFLKRLHGAEWVAIDTEADSLHAYPEKVCLIQISLPGSDDLVDPLAGLELGSLWQVLQERRLIMHGADYDLRMFRKSFAFRPSAVFDTMLAARLLGLQEFGLASLVLKFLGVPLEKGSQKADWARRPLTERMEAYARNDTRYLKPLADALGRLLEEKGRTAWHDEACDRLIADCSSPAAPDPEVWRIKGSHQLDRPELAVLRELWLWREKEALAAGRPPFFILQHEKLIEIAQAAVQLRPLDPLLPRRFPPRRLRELLQAVERGVKIPEEEHPQFIRVRSRRPTQAELVRFDQLERVRNERAAKLELDPSLIASRSMLFLLARDWAAHEKGLMNWQRELLTV